MCFTPAVSLATAITEFSITGYIVKRKQKILWPLATMVWFLGGYQFCEFMLCVTDMPGLWARLAFCMYTVLPALLLHSFMNLAGKPFWKVTYALPIVFDAYILLQDKFLVASSCNLLTASVQHLMFDQNPFILAVYFTYYAAFPVWGLATYMRTQQLGTMHNIATPLRMAMTALPLALLLAHLYFLIAAANHIQPHLVWLQISIIVWMTIAGVAAVAAIPLARTSRLFNTILLITILSSVLTTFILYAIFPQYSYDFPSIYCHFALLYGLAALIIAKNTGSLVFTQKS